MDFFFGLGGRGGGVEGVPSLSTDSTVLAVNMTVQCQSVSLA